MGIKFHRINALLIRHLYLYKRSLPRIMDILFWPVMTLILWGFISKYLEEQNISGVNIATILLGAIVLWEILGESQHSTSVAFLEEIWERNLVNIFVSPLKISEFLISTLLLGIIRVLLVTSVLSVIAFFSYAFNIFDFGFYILPFALNLILFGLSLGFFITAIILRFGTSAQILAFGILFLIQPFTAVFYPVSVLPSFAKYIALALPSTYVFEGMRQVINFGSFSSSSFLIGLALNLVYLSLTFWLFYRMFAYVKKKGKMMKLD